MDQRELHLQNLGICYGFYNFITKTLAPRALKTVTFGRCTHCSSASTALRGSESKPNKVGRSETPCKNKELPPTQGLFGDCISSPPSKAEEKNNPSMNVGGTGKDIKASLPKMKSLRKTVSISDNVEEIVPSKMMKKKRSKSFKKSGSLDQEEEEEDEPKPLRSILKVSSDLNDKSNSIC